MIPLWTLSGAFAILISIGHVYLGLAKVTPNLEQSPRTPVRLYQGFFVISGLYWAVGGAALIAFANAPQSGTKTAIMWAALIMYISGAATNAWATRARHFGWVALAVVVILIVLGA